MPPLSLLIKPVSGACQMNCQYCFYADELRLRKQQPPLKMTRDTLETIVQKALAYADGSCTFTFQGGEPTLAGLDFYEECMRFQSKYNVKGVSIQNTIQTNGYALDEAWAFFLQQHHFLVGVSLDGPKAYHDHFRVDANGRGTHQRVMQAIKLLKQYHVDFNILTVVTREIAKHIEKTYHFFSREQLLYQQYIPCIEPFEPAPHRGEYALSPQDFGQFLCRLFDLWYLDVTQGKCVSIRYFENLVSLLLGQSPETCTLAGQCAVFYVIESNAAVYPCDFYCLDAYELGNLHTNTFAELDAQRRALAFTEPCVPTVCVDCPWYRLCRGGCRRERENVPGHASPASRLCLGYRTFFSYALPRLQEVSQLVISKKQNPAEAHSVLP